MIPRFGRKEYGYDMRQVDEYIDKLQVENDALSRANYQLLMLYLEGETGDSSAEDDAFSLNKAMINRRLVQLLDQQAHDPQRDMDLAMEELSNLRQNRPRRKVSVLGLFFYVLLAGFILASYWFGGEITAGPPQNIAGFSAMVVLSRSMQHDIPQDSLIVTRQVDPATIRIGDDITFLRSDNTTVTHRVINIHLNYNDSGMRGFETAGTANAQRDEEVVLASSLVGRVLFHNLILGRAVLFVRTNILLVSIFSVVAVVMITVLRAVLFRDKKGSDADRLELGS